MYVCIYVYKYIYIYLTCGCGDGYVHALFVIIMFKLFISCFLFHVPSCAMMQQFRHAQMLQRTAEQIELRHSVGLGAME